MGLKKIFIVRLDTRFLAKYPNNNAPDIQLDIGFMDKCSTGYRIYEKISDQNWISGQISGWIPDIWTNIGLYTGYLD